MSLTTEGKVVAFWKVTVPFQVYSGLHAGSPAKLCRPDHGSIIRALRDHEDDTDHSVLSQVSRADA